MVRTVVAAVLSAVILSCVVRHEQIDPMLGLQEKVVKDLQNGDCDKAIETLQSRQDLRHEPRWYYLLTNAQSSCYQKTRDLSYKYAALKTLDEAVVEFPSSSRVLAWRGFFAAILGEHNLSEESYRAARQKAEENIRVRQSSGDDKAVLRELNESTAPK